MVSPPLLCNPLTRFFSQRQIPEHYMPSSKKDIIYVSDMDGTLLRNDATLSEYSFNALSRMIGAGLWFTVASARSAISIRPMLRGLELSLPVIEFNGAFVTDLASNCKLIINDLQKSALIAAYGIVTDFGIRPFVSTYDGTCDRVFYERSANEGMDWYVNDRQVASDPRFTVVSDVTNHFDERVVCLTVIERRHVVEQLRTQIEAEIPTGIEVQHMENQYHDGWHWLTIHDAKANKGEGLESLVEFTGLNGVARVVFGDHMNDLQMFTAADRSYAVSNAKEALKREATAHIGSNQEDSVVRFIEAECKL